MKLYICWGTCPVPGGHPCRLAYEALAEAGHDPEVVKAYGTRLLADSLDWKKGGRDVQRLIDERRVPVLVTDDGEFVSDTRNIVAWAKEHPGSGTAASA